VIHGRRDIEERLSICQSPLFSLRFVIDQLLPVAQDRLDYRLDGLASGLIGNKQSKIGAVVEAIVE
jgi:hypothetical protein